MQPVHFQPQSLVGEVIDGRYRLAAHLANGGMGSIFRAEHVYMRKEVALKLLRPDLSALPDIAERFRREAEIAASLENANIVRVTDFGKSGDGWLFLVMELLRGESLFERMRVGPLPAEVALPILVQICSGLEAAHARGVVHRDLKPENVFLIDAPSPWVKLLDFGIAKISDPLVTSDTAAGVVVGTPEYASPEQASGAAVDGRADVYAVGIVAWRMLAGYHPFPTDDSRRLLMMQATRPVPSIADARPALLRWPGVAAIVDRACAKDPDARFQSAAEMRGALEACLPEALRSDAVAPAPSPLLLRSPVPAIPLTEPFGPMAAAGAGATSSATPIHERRQPVRRRRVAALAAAALAVIVGAGFAASAVQHQRERRRAAQAAALAASEQSRAEAARRQAADAARQAAEQRVVAEHTTAERLAAEGREREARRRDVDRLVVVARGARGADRLRALAQLRELGAEARIPPAVAYGPLLADRDCGVRRAAALRLGEIGSRAALKPLLALARATREVDEGYLFKRRAPECGASEAAAAAARIERQSAPSTSTAQRGPSKGG